MNIIEEIISLVLENFRICWEEALSAVQEELEDVEKTN